MIEITVLGIPGPQGSKRHVGNGRMVESSKKVKPWRDSVAWAAREAVAIHGMIVGPVAAYMVFTLPKPKSAPKTKRTYPDRTPDIDKLLRSTFDGLTTGGIWEDDARVIDIGAMKVYPNEATHALDIPGVFIRLWAVKGRE